MKLWKKRWLRLLRAALVMMLQCTELFIKKTSGLRNSIFNGFLNPQQFLESNGLTAGNSIQSLNISGMTLSTSTSTSTATTITSTSTSTISPSQAVQASGTGSVLSQAFRKISLEEINKDIKEIIQKESSSSNFGQCIFTTNPYLDLGCRETDYVKCKQFLLSVETWLDGVAINSLIQELLPTHKLSIPSRRKFVVPSLETLFKETFLQVCVTFFVDLVNSGSLYMENKVCTGTTCHDQLNSICRSAHETYGKSASVLGSASAPDVVQKICQESRRQISLKYPTLVASPADIRPDNVPVVPVEPIPT